MKKLFYYLPYYLMLCELLIVRSDIVIITVDTCKIAPPIDMQLSLICHMLCFHFMIFANNLLLYFGRFILKFIWYLFEISWLNKLRDYYLLYTEFFKVLDLLYFVMNWNSSLSSIIQIIPIPIYPCHSFKYNYLFIYLFFVNFRFEYGAVYVEIFVVMKKNQKSECKR